VIAPHLCFPAAANSAEGAAIPGWVLAFKTLRTETLPRLGSLGLGCARAGTLRPSAGRFRVAAESFGAAAKRGIPPDSRSSTKTIRHRSIGIRNTQPVSGIVRPYVRPAEPRMEVAKTEAMEEPGVQENAAAEPIRSPSPTEPAAPQAPAAAEIKSKVDAGQEGETYAQGWVEERGIVTVHGGPQTHSGL